MAAYFQHMLGHDRIQYLVAFLGCFMIFAMWLFPEVKREEKPAAPRGLLDHNSQLADQVGDLGKLGIFAMIDRVREALDALVIADGWNERVI